MIARNRIFLLGIMASLASVTTNVMAEAIFKVNSGDSQVEINGSGIKVNSPNGSVDINLPTQIKVEAKGDTSQVSTGFTADKDYINAELIGIDFSNKDLSGKNFSNAEIANCDFTGANLTNAIFNNADIENTNFSHAILTNSSFIGVTLTDSDISFANFGSANLTNADLDNVIKTGANFKGAILTNVEMSALIEKEYKRKDFYLSEDIVAALSKENAARASIDLSVNFAFDSDKLTAEGKKQVAEIAKAIASPALEGGRFILEGHTDSQGEDDYNDDLSTRRAFTVMKMLKNDYGLNVDLSIKGYGEKRPIADNSTDTGRAMNRRVTLVRIK